MSPQLNKIQLIGRLGAPPEGRFLESGKQVCNFSLAVNRRWKRSDGENQETTDWFKIETWDGLAKISQDYLTTGSLVYVEGRLKNDIWEPEEGDQRKITKVVARDLQFLDRKPSEEAEEAAMEAAAAD
jgi:single-strand DNA-binding protein